MTRIAASRRSPGDWSTPDGKILVTVNDPEQDPKREAVTLGWNGKKYRIQLPSGTYCGQPVTVDLSGIEPLKDTSK